MKLCVSTLKPMFYCYIVARNVVTTLHGFAHDFNRNFRAANTLPFFVVVRPNWETLFRKQNLRPGNENDIDLIQYHFFASEKQDLRPQQMFLARLNWGTFASLTNVSGAVKLGNICVPHKCFGCSSTGKLFASSTNGFRAAKLGNICVLKKMFIPWLDWGTFASRKNISY